jgi:hypothetical protein
MRVVLAWLFLVFAFFIVLVFVFFLFVEHFSFSPFSALRM